MKRLLLFLGLLGASLATSAQAKINTNAYKSSVDTAITGKTGAKSITAFNVGRSMTNLADSLHRLDSLTLHRGDVDTNRFSVLVKSYASGSGVSSFMGTNMAIDDESDLPDTLTTPGSSFIGSVNSMGVSGIQASSENNTTELIASSKTDSVASSIIVRPSSILIQENSLKYNSAKGISVNVDNTDKRVHLTVDNTDGHGMEYGSDQITDTGGRIIPSLRMVRDLSLAKNAILADSVVNLTAYSSGDEWGSFIAFNRGISGDYDTSFESSLFPGVILIGSEQRGGFGQHFTRVGLTTDPEETLINITGVDYTDSVNSNVEIGPNIFYVNLGKKNQSEHSLGFILSRVGPANDSLMFQLQNADSTPLVYYRNPKLLTSGVVPSLKSVSDVSNEVTLVARGVDGTTTGSYSLNGAWVDSEEYFVPTEIFVVAYNLDGAGTPASITLGYNSPTYDNVSNAPILLDGFSQEGDYIRVDDGSLRHTVIFYNDLQNMHVNVTSGASGFGDFYLDVYLRGYLSK